jgi:hypothetical protein
VISSSPAPTAEVFKDAVQGLAKICFPEGILDQLGVEVLEQHMRQEKAPEENLHRMGHMFRDEMANRVVWMLAPYVDAPFKTKGCCAGCIVGLCEVSW